MSAQLPDFAFVEDHIADIERRLSGQFDLTLLGQIQQEGVQIIEGSEKTTWQAVAYIEGGNDTPCNVRQLSGSESVGLVPDSVTGYEVKLPWNQPVNATMRIIINGLIYYFTSCPNLPRQATKNCIAVMRNAGEEEKWSPAP